MGSNGKTNSKLIFSKKCSVAFSLPISWDTTVALPWDVHVQYEDKFTESFTYLVAYSFSTCENIGNYSQI